MQEFLALFKGPEVVLEGPEVVLEDLVVLELLEEIIDAPGHPAARRNARTASTSPSYGASELRQCRWRASSTRRSSASRWPSRCWARPPTTAL